MASQSVLLEPTHPRTTSASKQPRRYSMELPERFRGEQEDEGDAMQPDAAHPEAYIQQSMYGVIAAVHGNGGAPASLHPDSGSDTETEGEGSRRNSKDLSRTGNPDAGVEERRARARHSESDRRRENKTAEGNMLRSFLKPIREQADSRVQDSMSHSQILPPKGDVAGESGGPTTSVRRNAPMLDRKVQAMVRADMESSTSTSSSTRQSKKASVGGRPKPPVALPEALAEIFQFDEPEDLISEYACWYLQSALLQGYMYITQKHVCFYAYLQKKGNVIKSGHLGKQSKHGIRYRRYWITLKGDVLSYHSSASEPYFPSGAIDLRYGIAAELNPEKDQDRDNVTNFIITTDKRTYYFRAESALSAKEWVRQLQKVIFRSRNEGDSVKISLPLENVVDVERISMADYADTVKIRVIDNDETYAVDEYFFTFFSHGNDALGVLKVMTKTNDDAKKAAAKMAQGEGSSRTRREFPRRSLSDDRSPPPPQASLLPIPEPVRSTISPVSAGGRSSPILIGEQTTRSGMEVSKASIDSGRARTSFEKGGRSGGVGGRTSSQSQSSKSPVPPSPKRSTESVGISSERALSLPQNVDHQGVDMSASQVLGAPTPGQSRLRQTSGAPKADRLYTESRGLDQRSTRFNRTTTQAPPEVQPERADNKKSQPTAVSAQGSYPLLAITNPLQHAYNFAGAVRDQGKRMTYYLSNSPKSYYERFSGAIAGGKRHYSEADGLTADDWMRDTEEDLETAEHERSFQEHFALPATERLRAVYFCWLHRVLPLYGKIYISDHRFCFRSLLYGTRTKLVVPYRDVENVNKEKGFRWGYPGLVLVIRGHEELFFDFGSPGDRDDCVVTVLRGLDATKATLESILLTEEEKLEAEEAAAENELLRDARRDSYSENEGKSPSDADEQLLDESPVLFDDPNASMLDFKPKESLRITCLTIGSRGDVQPYIALCKGLLAHGHRVKIATHIHFKDWIEKHGVDFAPVEGDPAELMRLCVELGVFTPSFIYETGSYAHEWLHRLLDSSWKACQDADLLIESPSAMCGIHIAESLKIPYFRAFTMPWTKTRAYPHAFAPQGQKFGGKYNYMTYIVFENLFWRMTASHINKWRAKTLKLKPTDLGKMQPNKVPFLYNFSPSVVIPPLDFSDWIRVTGYWFLDDTSEWEPSKELLAFIRKAREDNMKLVYIGFGSIPMADSLSMTKQIIGAVRKADVRCIFSKGWSDHFDKDKTGGPELPPEIFHIRSVPHEWLFKQIDAAVHHGGAGTTGASLRAGVPTVIKPFFGDQNFFASRVEDLGVGIHLRNVSAHNLGKAIWLASHDARMQTKARKLGEKIRQENGVENAINAIYRDLEYAKTLIKRGDQQTEEVDEDDPEESWTFVEDESDVDVTSTRRASDVSWRTQSRHQSFGSTAIESK